MCGIVGYAGEKQAAPILLEGLSKLDTTQQAFVSIREKQWKLKKQKGDCRC